ncbi:MAG: alkaline phosphatase [Dermatophilus congolensis]|nr:alkaline phosphatase [Dermatophilus congolensis]
MSPQPENTPEHNEAVETDGGLSRRSILRGGGAGVASAVILGLGWSREAATAATGNVAPASTTKAASANLKWLDPHAFTGRSIVGRHPEYLQAAAAGEVAIRIIPIDRAKFLVNSQFDLRVEATGVDPATAKIEIKVSGPKGAAAILRGTPERTSSVERSLEVTYKGVYYPEAGDYTITAKVTSGTTVKETKVTNEVVVAKARGRRAKNVIFFLGDGMGQPAITAARILSKGMKEGKYHGLLEMDRMDYRGMVTTSGYDSIATDSANSMHAYMTGHKSSVNAMGVYEGNNPDPAKHPHVETMAEMVKRAKKMAVGIVTTAEIQDATPAAVFAHTRRRSEYVAIMEQALQPGQMPDVYMGGGMAALVPQSVKGSKRKDARDLRDEFKKAGFAYASSRAELKKAMSGKPEKLLGTFHMGNLNVYIDRQHAKDPKVLGDFQDQPTLMEMTEAALKVLEKKKDGFFLVVEGASIDKMEHPQDGPRAVYDAIELDKCVGIAKEWAKDRGDTLIVVTADHNHSMSIVGTHDRRDKPSPDREGNGVYGDAGFPTYVDSDGDGFPDNPDADVQLFFGWSNHPDHHDDFQHNKTFMQPALADATTGKAVPNPERDGDAVLQIGNLPGEETNCVHTVEDVSVMAKGPGSHRFNAVLDNTEIFFAIADAMDLRLPTPKK